MIIERVDIRRFGCLSEVSVSFDADYTLICGGNETGKSTLAAFIRYMLYGFPTDEKGMSEERVLRTPRDGAAAEGSMIFRVADGRYLVERRSVTGADGYRDEVHLTDLATGKTEMPGISLGERFLGVDAETYDNTARFAAGDLKVDGARTAAAIGEKIFSVQEHARKERAVRVLRDISRQLVGHDGTGGAVGTLVREMKEKEAALALITEHERELLSKENQLHETRRKHKEAVKELEKFRHLETDYRNVSIIRDYDRLHALEDELTARETALETFIEGHEMGEIMPDASYLAEITAAKTALGAAETALTEAKARAEEAHAAEIPITAEEKNLISAVVDEQTGRERQAEVQRIKKRILLNLIAIVLFGVLLLAGAGLLIYSLMDGSVGMIFLSAVMLIISVGGGTTGFLERRRSGQVLTGVYQSCCAYSDAQMAENIRMAVAAQQKYEAHMQMLRDADAVRIRAEEQWERAYADMEAALARFSESMPDDFKSCEALIATLAHSAGEFIRESGRLRAAKEETEAEVRALRYALRDQNEVAVRARVAPADRPRLYNLNEKDLHHGVEHYERLVRELTEREAALCRELAAWRTEESPSAMAESITVLSERIRVLRERAHHCTAAADAIEQSGARLQGEIAPRLSEYAGRMLERMTEGRYSTVAVTEALSPSTVEGEHMTAPAALGAATSAQLFLALRLALVDLLYAELPPLVFDECTAAQDDEHATAFFRTLRLLTHEDRQCIVLTCHGREEAISADIFVDPRTVRL